MVDRNNVCRACEGTGMLADDEEWQYTCTICGGDGRIDPENQSSRSNLMNVDDNNRILD
jgi:DnaJ-class molecular chaperone